MRLDDYENIIRDYLAGSHNLTANMICSRMGKEGYKPVNYQSVCYVLDKIRRERKIPYKFIAQTGYVYNYVDEVKLYDPRDELVPCPHCGNEYVEMYVNRMKVSYIKCHCGAKFEIDCTHCSDTPVDGLVMGLFRGWNKRHVSIVNKEENS